HKRTKRDWSSDVCSSDLKSPSLRNCRIPRAGRAHRSGIMKSRVLEGSTAQESYNLKRWKSLPLRNCRISRAGRVYRSEIAESHVLGFLWIKKPLFIHSYLWMK